MKFTIRRASASGRFQVDKPCENAIKEELTFYDKYEDYTFEDYQRVNKVSFFAEGFDHKVYEKGIVRSIKKDYWTIAFNSLEELIEFISKNGDVVICEKNDTDYNHIIIYDDYME